MSSASAARPGRGGSNSVIQSRILNRLRLAAGFAVDVDELVDAAYYDHADGGPAYARGCVRYAIMTLRRAGFPIETVAGRGWGWRFAPTLWIGDAPIGGSIRLGRLGLAYAGEAQDLGRANTTRRPRMVR